MYCYNGIMEYMQSRTSASTSLGQYLEYLLEASDLMTANACYEYN